MLHLTRRIPARVWVALTAVLGLGAALLGTTALAPRAEAATLTQVSAFGSNPGNLNMYVYVPATLPDDAPLVVLLHGCSQDAATYHAHSGWAAVADSLGFALVTEQKSANNSSSCFNWFQKSDTRGSVKHSPSAPWSTTRCAPTAWMRSASTSPACPRAAPWPRDARGLPDVFAGEHRRRDPTGCASSLLDDHVHVLRPQPHPQAVGRPRAR